MKGQGAVWGQGSLPPQQVSQVLILARHILGSEGNAFSANHFAKHFLTAFFFKNAFCMINNNQAKKPKVQQSGPHL